MSENKEHKNRIYTLIGVALALFLGALDQTIVSTAMPRIVADLSGLERYTWVTTVYLLVSTLLVPIYGKLSDIRSRRGLELWSVCVFLAGSALCGLAGEFGPLPLLGDAMNQLIVARGIQAIGGAGIFALAFIIVSDLYPPRERGKINGMFGAVFGLSSVFGPLIGGFLTDNAGAWIPAIHGWRWVFWVNIPIGAAALWFIVTRMPRLHAHDKSHKMDYLSAFLMLTAFFPLVLGLQLDKSSFPWTSPTILGLLGGSAVMMAVWIAHSFRSAHPIVNLRLFASKVIWSANLAVFFFGAAFMSVIIFLPLYMVNVQGYSATQAGASVIPLSLGIVVGAQLSGTLVSRIGRYKAVALAGAAISLGSGVLLATLGTGTPFWLAIAFMIITGIGFGPSQSLYALAIQNAVKPQEIGQATSTVQFSRQIGAAIGAAVIGVIFTSTLAAAFADHLPRDAGGPPVTGQENSLDSKGPKEIREGFDRTIAAIDPLFALRGAEAEAGLAAFVNDPSISPDERTERAAKFGAGTPAIAVGKAWEAFLAPLQTAFLAIDARTVERLLAGAGAPDAAGRPGPAAGMPESVRAMLARQAADPSAEARRNAWAEASAAFAESRRNSEDAASARAAAAAKQALADARDRLLTGLRNAFADAIAAVMLANLIALSGVLIATFLIPSLQLRGKGEAAQDGAPVPRGDPA